MKPTLLRYSCRPWRAITTRVTTTPTISTIATRSKSTTTTAVKGIKDNGDKLATHANRSRKRRQKSLSALFPKSPRTTRDRVQWLRERNAVLKDNYYAIKARNRTLDDWGNTAEERLMYVRDKIYSFWNSTGRRDSDPRPSGRPLKPQTQMDAKWWFWNIAWALFPAFAIACYCEFIAKPEMIQYNQIALHVDEQRKLLGDKYDQENDAQLKLLLQQVERPFGASLYDAARDLAMEYWKSQTLTKDPTNLSGPAVEDNKNNHDESKKAEAAVAPAQSTPLNVIIPQDSKDDDIDADAAAIAELKRKLEELEQRFQQRRQRRQGEHDASPQSEATPQQLHQQSRIYNRIIQKRQDALEMAAKHETVDKTTTTTTTAACNNDEENQQSSWWQRLYTMVPNPFVMGTEESETIPSQPRPALPQLEPLHVTMHGGNDNIKSEPVQRKSATETSSSTTVTATDVANATTATIQPHVGKNNADVECRNTRPTE